MIWESALWIQKANCSFTIKKMRELEGVNEDEYEERRAIEIIDFEIEKKRYL
ncbi:hypothetical protein OL548_09560 [Lysinibacillus sp. MHQ-1]|nr:hypothetical protein OL548_09560 [Lysinibacillus sp. MHQ-1]